MSVGCNLFERNKRENEMLWQGWSCSDNGCIIAIWECFCILYHILQEIVTVELRYGSYYSFVCVWTHWPEYSIPGGQGPSCKIQPVYGPITTRVTCNTTQIQRMKAFHWLAEPSWRSAKQSHPPYLQYNTEAKFYKCSIQKSPLPWNSNCIQC